ncbi:prepilin-type N-terminal cleavage/methylation domain-containing protein [bacterium]|nr:prepilin-type N-terminal cleavage/methylation domain-containing protein [bacterium]
MKRILSSCKPGGAGFTLPEVIIAVVILGIVASVGSLMFQAVNEKSRLAVASSNALSDLRYAQETAMAEHRDVNFTVNASGNSYAATYAVTGAAVKSPQKQSESLVVVLGVDETTGVSITAANPTVTFNSDGIPFIGGVDLAGPLTVMTLNGERSIVLMPSGYSEVQ